MTDVRLSRVDADVLSDTSLVPTVRLSRVDVDVLRDSTTPTYVQLSRVDVDVLRELDPFTGTVIVVLNGVNVSATSQVLMESVVIRDELNERPNTCTFVTRYASAFSCGMPLVIALGADTTDTRIFAGTILNIRQLPREAQSHWTYYEVNCQDYTWLIDRRTVTAEYSEQAADTIVTSAMSSSTSAFTVTHVQPSLTTVRGGFKAINLKVSELLNQIAKVSGANWYIDYGRDLHFYVSEATTSPLALTDGNRSYFWDLEVERDLSQLRTRVIVEGQSSTVTSDIPAGSTVIGVEDSTLFSTSGGTARLGTQIITYTGVSDVPTPDHSITVPNPGVNGASGIGGVLEGSWLWIVTVLVNGAQSVCSNLSAGLFNVALADGIAGRVYWNDPAAAAGRTYRIYRLNWNGANPFNEPRFNGDPYPKAGYNGATVFAYKDHNATPDSGLYDFQLYDYGDMVGWTALPADYGVSGLTGVPPSGVGSVLVSQPEGTEIVVRATSDNATAQGTIATLEGGDGIHEQVISDSTLDTEAAQFRADAELASWSGEIITLRYKTRDLQTRSGRTVSVDLPAPISITNTFTIQTVEIRDFDKMATSGASSSRVYPVRYVTASPVKTTSIVDIIVGLQRAA